MLKFTGSVLAVLMLMPSCFADTADGEAVLKSLGHSAKEVQKLEAGEVITKLAAEYEQSPRELAIDATVLIRKPLDELVAESENDVTLVPGKLILDHGEISSEQDLDAVGFTSDEIEEARRWLNAKPGDDLNLGEEDLAIIQQVKANADGRSEIELASEAARKVLKRRYRAYMTGGLDAIEPYARKRKKKISAGKELKDSNETLHIVEEHFPDYYDTLVNFPSSADCCEQILVWLKAEVRDRPMFVLMHRIILETDEISLLTERHYYVSHTLNSLQLTLGWMPWKEGDQSTYLGIATSANSDFLTGLVGKMIRVLGANKGAEMVGGVLTDIRDDLEAGVDPLSEPEG